MSKDILQLFSYLVTFKTDTTIKLLLYLVTILSSGFEAFSDKILVTFNDF